MPSISKSEHDKFTARITEFLIKNEDKSLDRLNVNNEVRQMQSLFQKYKIKITECRDMTIQYRSLQKIVQSKLRRQLFLEKKQIKLSSLK